jgi:hypothetical protein
MKTPHFLKRRKPTPAIAIREYLTITEVGLIRSSISIKTSAAKFAIPNITRMTPTTRIEILIIFDS